MRWKCHLENVGHFVFASMCSRIRNKGHVTYMSYNKNVINIYIDIDRKRPSLYIWRHLIHLSCTNLCAMRTKPWVIVFPNKNTCLAPGQHLNEKTYLYDDVMKWKHFPHYWPFVLGIHQSLVNSQHKGQWRGALMFSLICVWINGWVNNREAGDLKCHCANYDVIVMFMKYKSSFPKNISTSKGLTYPS